MMKAETKQSPVAPTKDATVFRIRTIPAPAFARRHVPGCAAELNSYFYRFISQKFWDKQRSEKVNHMQNLIEFLKEAKEELSEMEDTPAKSALRQSLSDQFNNLRLEKKGFLINVTGANSKKFRQALETFNFDSALTELAEVEKWWTALYEEDLKPLIDSYYYSTNFKGGYGPVSVPVHLDR